MNYIKVGKLAGRMGHQLAEWNTALSVAEYYALGFIHQPLKHGWEDKFKFGENELRQNSIKFNNIINLPKFNRTDIESIRPQIESNDNTLFILADSQNLESHWITEKILKDKWKTSPINQPFEEGFNIGIHIRRGDVTKERYPNRWVSNNEYVEIIETHLSKYKNYKLHIFSEGTENEFKEFKNHNPIFHLNGDQYKTFNKMVKCDVLVTGKSGYSYFASIISEGDIIAIPFWHSYPNIKRITKL